MDDDFISVGSSEPIKIPIEAICDVSLNENIVRVKIDDGITFPIILDTNKQAKEKFEEIKEKIKKIYSKQRIYREERED